MKLDFLYAYYIKVANVRTNNNGAKIKSACGAKTPKGGAVDHIGRK